MIKDGEEGFWPSFRIGTTIDSLHARGKRPKTKFYERGKEEHQLCPRGGFVSFRMRFGLGEVLNFHMLPGQHEAPGARIGSCKSPSMACCPVWVCVQRTFHTAQMCSCSVTNLIRVQSVLQVCLPGAQACYKG